MARLYVNHYSTKLTAQLLVGGTTANVTAGDGAALAGANGTDWFIGTLRRMSGYRDVAREIVKITNRSTDALTIVRAQESTTALQFEVGDQLDVDFTAASLADAFSLPIVAAGGTVDVITATYVPAIALTDQKLCAFVSTGANTSPTPTFAPNGLTARTITARGGLALAAGDIGPAGFVAMLEYNLANTRWELLNPAGIGAAGMTNPMTTGGDVIYGGASGVPTRLANGSAGQVLQSNGTTVAPSWATPSGGGGSSIGLAEMTYYGAL